jgi:DNA-binding transcriptional ArsR family regulator
MSDTRDSNSEAAGVKPTVFQRLQTSVPEALAMLAALQLELFTVLAEGTLTPSEVAARLDVPEARVSRLLYALTAAGLLKQCGGRFSNSQESAHFLVKGRPAYIGDVHGFLSQVWKADLHTAESVRSGSPAALHDFSAATDDEMKRMLQAMHPNTLSAGQDLLQRHELGKCGSVIDIGGGSGGLIATLCNALPNLRGTLFDLPRTAELAKSILARTPGGDRVGIEEGDILVAPPKSIHDAAILRALVQVLAPEDAARAIKRGRLPSARRHDLHPRKWYT